MNDAKKPCPPPFIKNPEGRCLAPRFVTPFGGPASGISPSGEALLGPVPPGCTPANVFADCFAECSGQITAASPGPLCGWTYTAVFGGSATPVIFTPGSMTITTNTDTDYIGVYKTLGRPLSDPKNVSAQFEFTEYGTPPNFTTTYQFFVTNPDLTKGFFLSMFGDGNGIIQVGDIALIPAYIFTWTPVPGAHHIVHLSIDDTGKPRIWIDHVEIPVTFFGDVITFFDQLPANTVSFFGGAGDPAPAESSVFNAFITQGTVGQETRFCCPG